MNNPHISSKGTKKWYNSKGELHRDDGPAVEWYDGDQWWLQNGEYHREDGPAIKDSDGYKAWYIEGKQIR
jgi:hypothetical protein